MIQTQMEQELPHWLLPPQQAAPPEPEWPADLPKLSQLEIAQIRHQDQLDIFERLFDPAIDALSGGTSITLFLSFDHRNVHPGRFMRWIKADPMRYRRYLEAREIAAELISGDVVGIADGKDSPLEDVQRSKLRVDARKMMMAFDAKERFTTTTKVDVSGHQTISVTAAMAPALERAKEMQRLAREKMTVTDVVVKQPLLSDLMADTTDPDDLDDTDYPDGED